MLLDEGVEVVDDFLALVEIGGPEGHGDGAGETGLPIVGINGKGGFEIAVGLHGPDGLGADVFGGPAGLEISLGKDGEDVGIVWIGGGPLLEFGNGVLNAARLKKLFEGSLPFGVGGFWGNKGVNHGGEGDLIFCGELAGCGGV